MRDRTQAYLAADPAKRPGRLPVVVTRTKSRVMPGWDAITSVIEHVDHTDRTALPPIGTQLRNFHTSAVG